MIGMSFTNGSAEQVSQRPTVASSVRTAPGMARVVEELGPEQQDAAALESRHPDEAAATATAIVARLYRQFDAGSLAAFDAVDESFEATVFGTTVLDWPGFVAFGRSFVDAFSDGRHEFDFVVADGDTVATVGHYCGHHDGPLMGVPPTGHEVRFTVMHVDRVEGGRIVEHRGIGDVNTMWTQLGAEPPAVD